MKFKKIIKKWRVILLLLFLMLSVIAINPQFNKEGVAVRHIAQNSTAAFAGMQSPSSQLSATAYERIIKIDNKKISSLNDYHEALASSSSNLSIKIETDKNEYALLKSEDLGITVSEIAGSNLKKGLELQGGSRVLLKPQDAISEQQRDDLLAVMEQRLNTYGLSDIRIRKADDLFGNKYVSVEVAGASKQEVKDLIASQGKFEARIGEEVVFEGGEKDVTFVCRNDGSCSGIRQCTEQGSGYLCTFAFQISLSENAAKRHAQITDKFDINISEEGREYLDKPLDLYLDDIFVESLQISADLKGVEA